MAGDKTGVTRAFPMDYRDLRDRGSVLPSDYRSLRHRGSVLPADGHDPRKSVLPPDYHDPRKSILPPDTTTPARASSLRIARSARGASAGGR